MTDDDELEVALAWLLGTDDFREWRSKPPHARPLCSLRCQRGRRGESCLLGAVYPTPFGLIFYGLHHGRTTVGVDPGSLRETKSDITLREAALLTYPDLKTARPDRLVPTRCKHGQTVESYYAHDLLERAREAVARQRDTPR